MIFKNKSFLFGIGFIAFAQALIAQTYCLKYDVVAHGNIIDVKISMTANGQAFQLGSSNIQFQYNTEALTQPVLLQSSLLSHPSYQSTTLTQPHLPSFAKTNKGLMSLNLYFKGIQNQGLPINLTEAGTELAVIRFKLKNAQLPLNIRPYDNGLKGSVIYNDDTHNPLLIQTTGNCPNYDRLVTEKEVKMKAYPSLLAASNAFLTLEVPDFESTNRQEYQILTVLGKPVMFGKTAAQSEINVSHLAAGAYFVKVGSEQFKFIIQ